MASVRIKALVVGGGVAVCTAWVCSSAREMSPVQPCTSAEFWQHACEVTIPGRINRPHDDSHGCDIYPPQGDRDVCYVQHLHGQDLYEVAADDADDDLPNVIQAIEKGEPSPWIEDGLNRWKSLPVEQRSSVALQKAMRAAHLDDLVAEYPELAKTAREDDLAFQERWRRVERYWQNIVFEIVLLSGLFLHAVYPWLRGAGRFRWAIHWGSLPVLLFLPQYLGYAPLTFSSAYPVGGVVYSSVLRLAATPMEEVRVEWTDLEVSLLTAAQVEFLANLSQPPGPMISLSGGGLPSPLCIGCLGFLIAAAVYAAGSVGKTLTAEASGGNPAARESPRVS